ncbi:MAG TPA: hypothetical protein DCY71_01400 [Clostridiaceae bacterium]|nr:hypothetical protein [Clostridiaceae bacterium]
MNIINYDEAKLPTLNAETLDMDKIVIEDNLIQIPFTDKLVSGLNMNDVNLLLNLKIIAVDSTVKVNKHIYFEVFYNDSPLHPLEFDLMKMSQDGMISESLEIKLSDSEYKFIKPLIESRFGFYDNILTIRSEVAQSMLNVIPYTILQKMHLHSEDMIYGRYRASWVNDDNSKCVLCKVDDINDKMSPTRIVTFGF